MVDVATVGEVGVLVLMTYELRRIEHALLLVARESPDVDAEDVRENLGLASPLEEDE